MKTKSLLLTLTAVLSAQVFAQNPIISNMFTPDPAPFVYGDKVYLFVDHDEENSTYFHMKDWMLYSTEDMVNWTYLGTMEGAVYVGDSDVDIMTARNSGLPCISVLWGFRDRDFLLQHGAETFVSTPRDILQSSD